MARGLSDSLIRLRLSRAPRELQWLEKQRVSASEEYACIYACSAERGIDLAELREGSHSDRISVIASLLVCAIRRENWRAVWCVAAVFFPLLLLLYS